MTPTILICSGPSRRDGEVRGQILTVPCAAARANHNSHYPTRVATPWHREPRQRSNPRWARTGALWHLEKTQAVCSDFRPLNPVRNKFIRSLKALRSLLSLPAVHLRQEQSRGKAPIFQSSILSAGPSGLVAVFDRHECSEREIPNDGKTEARPGNLTARDGKYAC